MMQSTRYRKTSKKMVFAVAQTVHLINAVRNEVSIERELMLLPVSKLRRPAISKYLRLTESSEVRPWANCKSLLHTLNARVYSGQWSIQEGWLKWQCPTAFPLPLLHLCCEVDEPLCHYKGIGGMGMGSSGHRETRKWPTGDSVVRCGELCRLRDNFQGESMFPMQKKLVQQRWGRLNWT